MTEQTTHQQIAEALDKGDLLTHLREQFAIPPELIYLDGNSLGAMQPTVGKKVAETLVVEWGSGLIKSWNTAGWVDLPEAVGEQIAPIIGAKPGTVIATDSTSVNVFKTLAAALIMRSDRRKIVSEKGNFPTDLYMTQATTAFLGTGHELVTVNNDDALMKAIDEETAVVLLTQVDYRTGRMLDMAKITAHAHEKGALIIWDLCHSAGAFPVALDACDADFAVGCGYKYLNGGPGAPAFIYVKKELQNEAIQPLSGWFAHEAPFDFDPKFRPAMSIKRYLTGTPPVLSLTALHEALKIWKDVDMRLVRQKSVGLSQLFIQAIEETCEGLTLASPRDPQQRGSQVSFTFDGDGYALMQALIAEGVIGDFRQPNILRFGFAPLYIRYGDVVRAAEILADILKTERWKDEKFSVRSEVT